MQKKSEKWIENYIKTSSKEEKNQPNKISSLMSRIESLKRKNRKNKKELGSYLFLRSKLEPYKDAIDSRERLAYLGNELLIQSTEVNIKSVDLLLNMLNDELQKKIDECKQKIVTPELREMTEKIIDEPESQPEK